MAVERVEFGGELMALVLRKGTLSHGVHFFSPADNPLQVGILHHPPGHVVVPHHHKRRDRVVQEIQEALHVEFGAVEVDFYSLQGKRLGSVTLEPGDTILLLRGGHGLRVTEDFQAIEIKQGPYLGKEEDKEALEAKHDTGL